MEHRDAIGEVYGGSFRRLVVQLYAVTGDLGEAQEVVQEAFVRALAAPRGFADLDNPEAWLRRVAINLARTRWRRRRVLDRLLHRVATDPVVADPSPDHIVLMDALRELPDGQRHALALHYLSDLPIDEVARTLEVSVGTVKSRLHRGRVALAALLADEPPVADQAIKQPALAELTDRARRRVRRQRAAITAAVVVVALTAVQVLHHSPVRPPAVSPTATPTPVPTAFVPSSQEATVTVYDERIAVTVQRNCMIAVSVTTNAGATWSPDSRPLQAIDCIGEPDATFEVLSPTAYLAAVFGGTYFSGNSGATWEKWQPHVSLRPGLPDGLQPRGCDHCQTRYFEAVDSTGVVFRSTSQPPLPSWNLTRSTPDGSFWLLGTGATGGISAASTPDRGLTWKSGPLPADLHNASIGPVTANLAYVIGERAGREYLYRTRDAGLSWTEIAAPKLGVLANADNPPLIAAGDGSALVVGDGRTWFWRSDDGGETFEPASRLLGANGVSGTSRDGRMLWALNGNAIIYLTAGRPAEGTIHLR